MQSHPVFCRWGRIGILVDGQAGLCMGRCMGGAWVHGDGDVLGVHKYSMLMSTSRNCTFLPVNSQSQQLYFSLSMPSGTFHHPFGESFEGSTFGPQSSGWETLNKCLTRISAFELQLKRRDTKRQYLFDKHKSVMLLNIFSKWELK